MAGHNNVHFYANLFAMSITRKKLALLIFDSSLKWADVENEDAFQRIFKKVCPQKQTHSLCLPSNGIVNPPDVLEVKSKNCQSYPNTSNLFGDSDSDSDETVWSLEMHGKNLKSKTPSINYDSHNSPMQKKQKYANLKDPNSKLSPPKNENFGVQDSPKDFDFTFSPLSNVDFGVDDNLLVSFMSPPNAPIQDTMPNVRYNQQNAIALAKNFAPNLSVHGGIVNINYCFGTK